MSEADVCFSGGAEGADSVFGEQAEKAGHKVIHWSFADHFSNYKPHTIKLQLMELMGADPFLIEANKTLRRKFPTGKVYMDNLLRRNYYQIKDTERVYAISSLLDDGTIKGGTAWAVQMAIDKGVPEIYLFDQNVCGWYIHAGHNWSTIDMHEIPKPHGKYTGIGSRDLRPIGKKAIIRLYGQ